MSDREYAVTFDDGTVVENESPEIFEDEWLTGPSRPAVIRMSYRNYEKGRNISVHFNHGDARYWNEVEVSGSDTEWVDATFQALKDSLDKVRPQDSWALRHPHLLLHLIALGLGSFVIFGANLLGDALFSKVTFTIPVPHWLEFLRLPSLRPYLYLAGWGWRWLMGMVWGAHSVHRWLLNMWPSVEFDFGLPQLQTEKIRRGRLKSVVTLAVLPVFLQLGYDLTKAFLTR